MPVWLNRVCWFLGIWTASVIAMALLGGVLRWWLR